jgi:excisionase family DNA binding protein
MKPQISGLPISDKLAVTIADATRMSAIGRTKLYEFIKEGRLPVVKIGAKTLVRVDALDALLKSLEAPDGAPRSAA